MYKANRAIHLFPGLKPDFYRIKKKVLTHNGIEEGTDLQYIPGKKCWSCHNGVFIHFSGTQDDCYKCGGTGWYILPKLVQLKRYRYKKHLYHIPVGSNYTSKPKAPSNAIDGYINHQPPKHPQLHVVLFMLRYAPGFIIAFAAQKLWAFISFRWRYRKTFFLKYLQRIKWFKKQTLRKIHNQPVSDDLPF